MHLIKLSEVNHSEKTLTQAVLQVTQMLGIYHAELARILRVQCSDIGELSNAENIIVINSTAWSQAEKYIELYELLYNLQSGDEALVNNWLRKKNKKLNGTPLYLMVDELRIDDVLEVLKKD
ncbi:MAG: hypothetical protein DIZ80_12440 [endosymbiont of Galathealinum brachiosum]|uniref:Antitoxin Xre/MbcA/ParS-like toxin-binding domain-containing protein n=1 Tax=endosymbiont of Galathealinum brachiosum TaxID=2200906 RepID=A0A370DDV1_9GAMM|nr:MAG: hypothetical protein DIZ80_12440 [endosymbiont of Galathealinum brachiosum]